MFPWISPRHSRREIQGAVNIIPWDYCALLSVGYPQSLSCMPLFSYFRLMKPNFLHRLISFSFLFVPMLATAATFTWDGGSAVDANSGTAENWVGDSPLTSNPDVIFGLAGISGTSVTWNSGNLFSMSFTADASAYSMANASGFQFVKSGVESIANNSLQTQSFNSNVRVFYNGSKTFNANTANLTLSSVTFRADGMVTGQINGLILSGANDGNISGVVDTAGTFSNLATGLRNSLTKTGTGTWVLAGANTYGGLTQVQNGTLTLSGNRTVAMAGGITLGGGGAVSQTLNLQNGNFSLGSSFTIGNGGSNALVNHSAGTISSVGGSGILLGNGNGTASYQLSAGALTGSMIMGVNLATSGTNVNSFNLSGTGSFTSSNLQIGRLGATGSFNTDNRFSQTGGTATITTLGLGGSTADSASASPISATLNLTSGVFSATTFASLSAGGANTSVITIGGTANVTLGAFPTLRGALSTATVHFDGGTLRPAAASTAYMGGLTNAFLTANGAKFDVASGSDITISQVLEDADSQNGTFTKLGAGVLTLTGANLYSGTTTITGGTLRIGAGGVLGGGAVINNSTLEFNRADALVVGNAISGTGTIYQKGSGTTTLDPGAVSTTVRALSADGGKLVLKSGTFTTSGTDPFNSAYTVGAGARGGVLTIDGATLQVGGGRSLKVGAAANGNLEIISGTVTASDLVLGHNGTSVGTQSGGSVTVSNLYHQDGGAGSSYTLSGGDLTVKRVFNNTASTHDFTLNLNGGNLFAAAETANLIDNGGRGGSEITVRLGSGNTVIDTSLSSATIPIGMENMPSVDGAFTKAGSNTLTLGGNSTYTGGTTVSAGGLLVTGSLGESAVSVGAGARFGGTGSVGGSVHFDSLASLEIVDLFDPLLIAGNVSFGSGFGFGNLIGFDVETVAPGTYTLLAGSNFNLGGLNHVDLANAFTRADGKQAYFQNGSLQVVVIPEPSSFLLGIVSVLGLMRRQRSHGGA